MRQVQLRTDQWHRRARVRALLGLAGLMLLTAPIAAWPLVGADVPLGPCGLGVMRFDDRKWTVTASESFTPADAPPWWQGHGVVTAVTDTQLSYRGFSGLKLTFRLGGESVC